MAVAYISDVDHLSQTGTSVAFTAYAISGTNPVVVVLLALASATEVVSSVVCSGGLTSGTPVEVVTRRKTNTYLSIWAIPAPTGTGTITATFSGSVDSQSCAILFQGADQTTPCPSADAVGTDGVTNPLTVTPAHLTANDASVGIGGNTTGGDAPVFTPTETVNSNSSSVNAAGGYNLGTGAVTVTWGTPFADDALVAVRVVDVAGGGGARRFLMGRH